VCVCGVGGFAARFLSLSLSLSLPFHYFPVVVQQGERERKQIPERRVTALCCKTYWQRLALCVFLLLFSLLAHSLSPFVSTPYQNHVLLRMCVCACVRVCVCARSEVFEGHKGHRGAEETQTKCSRYRRQGVMVVISCFPYKLTSANNEPLH